MVEGHFWRKIFYMDRIQDTRRPTCPSAARREDARINKEILGRCRLMAAGGKVVVMSGGFPAKSFGNMAWNRANHTIESRAAPLVATPANRLNNGWLKIVCVVVIKSWLPTINTNVFLGFFHYASTDKCNHTACGSLGFVSPFVAAKAANRVDGRLVWPAAATHACEIAEHLRPLVFSSLAQVRPVFFPVLSKLLACDFPVRLILNVDGQICRARFHAIHDVLHVPLGGPAPLGELVALFLRHWGQERFKVHCMIKPYGLLSRNNYLVLPECCNHGHE